jgi:hypothetical protein
VCELVNAPWSVTLLLYDEQFGHLPVENAVAHQREVGLTGTERQLKANALAHRRHIDKWMETDGAIAPVSDESGVVRIPPPTGPSNWMDANQQGMDIGVQAIGYLTPLLPTLEPADLIAVAKLGQTAATTRAGFEAKGQIRKMEALARLASGRKRPFAQGDAK